MQVAEKSESQLDQRVCPNCGESCEKEYETVFVNGQEFCVCCNSNIETCHTEEGLTNDFYNTIAENWGDPHRKNVSDLIGFGLFFDTGSV